MQKQKDMDRLEKEGLSLEKKGFMISKTEGKQEGPLHPLQLNKTFNDQKMMEKWRWWWRMLSYFLFNDNNDYVKRLLNIC